MPIIENQSYNPKWPFRYAHFNTIYPSLFRKVGMPNYERVRLNTQDDDFLDVDHMMQSSKRLAILCHGLEGSSYSKYMISTANLMFEKGWDVIAMNYRGCSGEINNAKVMYHAGKTDDLHLIIDKITFGYESISIIGFSLGGNMVLKYCGDGFFDLDKRIKSVISVSSPLDLAGGGIEISKPKNWIYNKRFVVDLKKKARLKAKQYTGFIDLNQLERIKTLFDFDDQFTSRIHGFKDASEYYAVNSANQFLNNIEIPVFILQAKDDPFLPNSCYPVRIARSSALIHLEMPKYGGHLGFYTSDSRYYWDEIKIEGFASNHL